MILLKLENLFKTYNDFLAVRNAQLEIERGEIFGLLGASGAGKTIILRIIHGSEAPSDGKIIFANQDVTQMAPEQRGFAAVFQNHPLSLQFDVFEEIAAVFKARHVPPEKIESRVAETLNLFGLKDLEKRRLSELSDGQRQLVSAARAIALEPQLLLLDNPFSNLDAPRREQICRRLKETIKKLGLTVVHATQNQEEAFALCDRFAVMENGQIVRAGTPGELYADPQSVAVARFLGRNNLIRATRLSSSNTAMPEFQTLAGEHRLFVDKADNAKTDSNDKIVTLMIRPENVVLPFGAAFPEDNLFKAKVAAVEYLGATTRITLDANGLSIETVVLRLVGLNVGDDCMISLPPNRISVLTD